MAPSWFPRIHLLYRLPHTHCTNVMNLIDTVRTLEQVIYKFVKFAS